MLENISWTDHVRSKEEIQRVKQERHIVHTVKERRLTGLVTSWRRNCLLEQVIEGKV
jgi:hypothetical protein